MKKLIATTIMMALLISSNVNAQQYNKPSMTSLKQKTDQWVKDIKDALVVFKGLNRSQEEKVAALDKIIRDLHHCGQATAKNGELSIEVAKAINLAQRQIVYCEDKLANPTLAEYSEGYRIGAEDCRRYAASLQRQLKDIHEKNAQFAELMVDFQKHRGFYLDMLVLGQIGLADAHLKKVGQSMEAVIKELEALGKMKVEQAKIPGFARR